MRKFITTLLSRIAGAIDLRDVHAYSGIVLIATGLVFVYWPAALIVSGAILLYMAMRRVT